MRDYEPDVFLALASTALELLPKDKAKRANLKETAKSVGKILGRVALKGAVRAVTAGAIKAGDFSEASEEVAEEISNTVEGELDEIIDERLSRSRQEEEAFKKFRDALASIAVMSSESQNSNKPVIFIVDELDRCRPDYALSVIETIKHFFSVQNVHFLILCQHRHLQAAIRHGYGSDVDADVYMEKFVNARLSFPLADKMRYKNQIERFVRELVLPLPDDGEKGQLKSSMVDFLSDISVRKRYSLRRIERIVTQFGLCLAYTKANSFRLGAVLFVLCDLKQSNISLFKKAKEGILSWKEIQNYYNFDEGRDRWYVTWLRYFYDETINLEDREWQSLDSSLWQYNLRDRADTASYLANKVVDCITA